MLFQTTARFCWEVAHSGGRCLGPDAQVALPVVREIELIHGGVPEGGPLLGLHLLHLPQAAVEPALQAHLPRRARVEAERPETRPARRGALAHRARTGDPMGASTRPWVGGGALGPPPRSVGTRSLCKLRPNPSGDARGCAEARAVGNGYYVRVVIAEVVAVELGQNHLPTSQNQSTKSVQEGALVTTTPATTACMWY